MVRRTEPTTMQSEAKRKNLKDSEKVSKENEAYAEKKPREEGESRGEETDAKSDLSNISTFEDLLQVVGTKGRWNLLLFLLCAYATFVSPMQNLSYQFLGATPDHWCRVDPLLEAGWTQEEIISFAIPVAEEGKHESCMMYDLNFTWVAELGHSGAAAALQDTPDNSAVVSCYARDFNRSQHRSTMTTEWDLVCERRTLYSTTQAASQVGKLVGCIFQGYLIDRFGRRTVVLWCSMLAFFSAFGSSLSPVVEVYIFLKIVLLAALSGIYLGCFTLLLETCGSHERSKLGTLFVLPWALGYMILPGIAYLVRPWKWLQVALSLPLLLLILYNWFLPESPRWLILQGRQQEALKVFKSAASMNGKKLPSDQSLLAAFEKLQTMVPIEHDTAVAAAGESGDMCGRMARWAASVVKEYLAVLRVREMRRRALVVFYCWFAAALVYYGISLNATTISADPYLYIFLGGLLEVPSYLLLWPAVVLLGRVKALALLYLLCTLTIFTLSLLMFFHPGASIGLLMFLSLSGKIAITAGFHLIWMFTLELFPTKYRSLATSQASVCARFGSVASPYLNDLLGESVVWGPSAVFTFMSLLAAGLSLVLPETRGESLQEGNSTEKDSGLHGQDNLACFSEIGVILRSVRQTEDADGGEHETARK